MDVRLQMKKAALITPDHFIDPIPKLETPVFNRDTRSLQRMEFPIHIGNIRHVLASSVKHCRKNNCPDALPES